MEVNEIGQIAYRMSKARRAGEDAAQEAWIAGWKVADQPRNYVVKTMANSFIGSARKRLGRNFDRPQEVSLSDKVVSNEVVEPNFPSDLDWTRVLVRTPLDRAMVSGVALGYRPSEIAVAMGFTASYGRAKWSRMVPGLRKAWKETQD